MVQLLYIALRNTNAAGAEIILKECCSRLPEPEDPVVSELSYNMLFNMVVQLKMEYPKLLRSVIIPVYIRGRQQFFRAREMLITGGVTANEVSLKCGLANTNSFCKSFKRNYGFPPSEIGAAD